MQLSSAAVPFNSRLPDGLAAIASNIFIQKSATH